MDVILDARTCTVVVLAVVVLVVGAMAMASFVLVWALAVAKQGDKLVLFALRFPHLLPALRHPAFPAFPAFVILSKSIDSESATFFVAPVSG